MRHNKFILLALAATMGLSIVMPPKVVWGLAGKLDRPSIAIPTVGEGATSKPDPICSAIQKALGQHAKEFVRGRFINAHSILEFGGSTAELNTLLGDLAAIEGAKLQIRFAKDASDPLIRVAEGTDDTPPYQWRIEHNAWSDAQTVLVTVSIGDGKIKVEELQIPTIVGLTPGGIEK